MDVKRGLLPFKNKWVLSFRCLFNYNLPPLGIYSCSMRTKQHWPPIPSLWQEVSAAPAICDGRLHGILSWAKGSITLGSEGFFTEVYHHARWILKVINNYWGPSIPPSSVQHLHNFYTEFTALDLSCFWTEFKQKTFSKQKKKWTKNSCCDHWSLDI